MKNKEIIKYANFYERFRYSNDYIFLSDYQFLKKYKEYLKTNKTKKL